MKMVFGQFDIRFIHARFCFRNQYNKNFNDFSLIIIGKTHFMERTEYKFGLFGIVAVLLKFNKQSRSFKGV